MERPSVLGRSLEDVLDSLTPTDPDPSAPGRVHFEPEDIEQQLDSLMGEIRDLRDRVQHLVALVPGETPEAKKRKAAKKAKRRKAGKKTKQSKGKQSGKGAKKAGKAKRAGAGEKSRRRRAAA
jgi:hypothetical protein